MLPFKLREENAAQSKFGIIISYVISINGIANNEHIGSTQDLWYFKLHVTFGEDKNCSQRSMPISSFFGGVGEGAETTEHQSVN